MAITVKTVSKSAQHDKDKTTYTRVYDVTATGSETEVDILNDGSIPQLFGAHPLDSGALVKNRQIASAGPKASGSIWTVTISWDNDPDEEQDNPLDKPTEFTWGAVKRDIVLNEDINGNAIVNSANDPFDNPPVIKQKTLIQLQLTKNFSSFDGSLAINYAEKVNSSAFQGGPEGTVLCEAVNAQGPNVENDITFYVVTASFLFDADGWNPRQILDQGFRQIVDNERVPIELNGVPVSSPVPLDGTGVKLAADGEPVFLDFDLYDEANFNSMGF